ncbi:MAG TPA: SDR family oxidoreductase [Candidatus Krumholzibacteria bacterium]|nr:SDR family oxidoreductase [Candidatus Krumholzibacteria bacterium]
MRFLVTGGAGFIGSNLVRALVRRGDTVVVLDDFSTGKRENIAGVADRITLVEGSLTDLPTVRRAVAGADFVLHQAALASVQRSVDDPLLSNTVNVVGTLNVLVAARDAGVKRLVYAASSSAYGDTEALPKHEDMPARPLSPYALQKWVGEEYCRIFTSLYGLDTIALRYFNVFGPHQDPNSHYAAVIPIFITKLLAGTAPTIYGDGEQSRDFTFIDNVVAANLQACDGGPKGGPVVNVACGERYSLNELFRSLAHLIGVDFRPQYAPPRQGDVRHSQADVRRAEALLGWRPAVDFQSGLARTVDWYRSTLLPSR